MTTRKTQLNRRGSLDATLRGLSVAALMAASACVPERAATDSAPDDNGAPVDGNGAAPVDGNDGAVSDSRPVTPDHPIGFIGDQDITKLSAVTNWFVEFENDPLALGGDSTAIDADLERFRTAATTYGLNLSERRVFRGILNGVTVRMSSDELSRVAALPNVRAIYPVGITEQPKLAAGNEPMLDSALGMTGASVVQEELGFDGTGIKVGVIDTGIDLQHPDLADRVTGGFDFVGDAYDATDPTSVPVPEPGVGSRPGGDDCGGHGTHVAGIIGAGGDPKANGARGVAPGVTFRAYRVFGCEGSTNDDTIAAAIELAFEDGMDIINLSLGSNNGFSNDFLSVALGRVLELGMIPVASAGNNGRAGVFTVGSPAAGTDVLTVASFDNVFTRVKRLTLSDGTEGGYSNLTGAPAAPDTGSSGPLVYVGQGCDADTYAADPAGKVALITRGTCPFAEKYTRAVTAGAIGVVIENNAPGNFAGTLGTATPTVFGITVSQETGAHIRTLLTAGTEVSINWVGGVILSPNPTGNQISAFSSYGLTPELLLKPDIGAPGGYIRSTWPLDRTDGESPGYAVLSGTSMSSPYIAGAVALLMEALPNTQADQVRGILQNNAEPKAWFGAPTGEYLDSVHRQGAGMLRIDRAIQATTQVTPSKLSLGESAQGSFSTVLYVRNNTDEQITYTLGNDVRSLATGPDVYVPAFSTGEATVVYSRVVGNTQSPPIQTIAVPAGGIRSVTVLITAPVDLPDQSVYGGYLTITPAAGSKGTAVTVPYAGFKGDFQSVEVLSRPVSLLKYAADTATYVEAPEGTAYTMVAQDRPGFAVGLRYGVQTLKAEIVPLDGDAWIKPQSVLNVEMMRRSNPGEANPFTMGEFDATSLPNGRYRIRVTMLKAGGDTTNPAHTATAESPYFEIARP
jgi:subtilisin family serine protease